MAPLLRAVDTDDQPLLTGADVITRIIDDLDELLPMIRPDDPATAYLRDLRTLLDLKGRTRRGRGRPRGV